MIRRSRSNDAANEVSSNVGIEKTNNGGYRANIMLNGVRKVSPIFKTKEEAIEWRLQQRVHTNDVAATPYKASTEKLTIDKYKVRFRINTKLTDLRFSDGTTSKVLFCYSEEDAKKLIEVFKAGGPDDLERNSIYIETRKSNDDDKKYGRSLGGTHAAEIKRAMSYEGTYKLGSNTDGTTGVNKVGNGYQANIQYHGDRSRSPIYETKEEAREWRLNEGQERINRLQMNDPSKEIALQPRREEILRRRNKK